MPSRVRHIMAALALGVLALILVRSAAAAAPTPSGNLTAYRDGTVLAPNPLLQSGDVVQLVVIGFARSADVTVRLVDSTSVNRIHADDRGVARYTYRVPTYLPGDDHLLTFQGDPASSGPVTATTASRPGNDQPLVVTVPNLAFFPFHVDPGATSTPPPSGSVSVSATSTTLGGGQGSRGGGGLAFTGIDVAALLILAALLIGPGVLAARSGRRRSGGQ